MITILFHRTQRRAQARVQVGEQLRGVRVGSGPDLFRPLLRFAQDDLRGRARLADDLILIDQLLVCSARFADVLVRAKRWPS